MLLIQPTVSSSVFSSSDGVHARKERVAVGDHWKLPADEAAVMVDASSTCNDSNNGSQTVKFSMGDASMSSSQKELPQQPATETTIEQTAEEVPTSSTPMVRNEKTNPRFGSHDVQGKASSLNGQIKEAFFDAFLSPEVVIFMLLIPFAVKAAQNQKQNNQEKKPTATTKSLKHVQEACVDRSARPQQVYSVSKTEQPIVALSPEEVAARHRLTEAFHVCVKMGNLDAAADAMGELEAQCQPTLPDYNAIISLCARTNNPQGAHEWLKRVETAGLAANSVCYNAVINAHAKQGDLQLAVQVAKRMQEVGVCLDTVTYNTVIDTCARVGDSVSADWWMKAMIADGVRPSVVSFGSVMLASARGGSNACIQYWLDQADDMGIELNMICFSAVINAFAKANQLASASKWYDVMRSRAVMPSIFCFTGMLELMLSNDDFDGAADLMNKMAAANVEPDTAMYNWLVTASGRAGCRERAQQWAEDAAAAGCKLNRAAIRSVEQLLPAGEKLTLVSRHRGASFPGAVANCNQAAQEIGPAVAANADECAEFLGRTYVGIVKEFVSAKFGYITCDETFSIFKRDIFLSSNDNPEGYAKGQRVSFTLFLDPKRALPRATNVNAFVRPKSAVPR